LSARQVHEGAADRADKSRVLEVRRATKRFGAVRALDGVGIELHAGEILAVLGDNGAGKSTLIKGISGVHRFDAGEVLVEGETVNPRSPADARALGIETVYQDLALFDNLSATANFWAGRELVRPRWLAAGGFLREAAMSRETRARLHRLQVRLPDASLELGLFSGGQRQAVAVARAVSFEPKIVILDEPTAALGVREARNVLEVIARLPEEGVSVILISHNLEHVTQVADRAVVLRGGRNVGEAVPSRGNHERLVAMIVGSEGI
jgi:D-xylose transport system ATP-binding protein